MITRKNYTLLDKHSSGSYGFYSKRGNYLDGAHFDPWTGKFLLTSYDGYYDYMQRCFNKIWKKGSKAINEAIRIVLIERRRSMHKSSDIFRSWDVCDSLYDKTLGYDCGMTRLTYIPTIRTFAFFRKDEKGVFDALDYCPFCGAKLPSRLDEKLSEILQTEYGLKDWHDYKKAPHEFHTNEWWIKRGL